MGIHERIAILEQTLELTKDYSTPPVGLSFAGSKPALRPGDPIVELTREKVQDTVQRLSSMNERIVLLNFASAKHPGGGVRYGAAAQEEDICRSSGLLHSLDRAPFKWYETWHIPFGYDDRLLVSRDVPFIRTSDNTVVDAVRAHVITCAAPNLGGDGLDNATANEFIRHRAAWIVYTAAALDASALVLGAWGCGVFGNNPYDVAALWVDAVAKYSGPIQRVVHPLFGPDENYDAFVSVYGG